MAMKRYYVLLLSAVLLLFTKSTHGHVGEIIELTDATFEHQTQVGTGTGTVRQTGTGATTNTARTLPPVVDSVAWIASASATATS